MKKYMLLSAVLLLVMAMAAGCGKKGSADASEDGKKAVSDESLNKVKEKGKFVLGLDDSFPPMGYKDENNQIVGFDIDVAGEVCSRMGVELVLQPIDWDAKEQELATGNIDCIWNGMSFSEDRKEKMELSDAYMKNTQVAVVLADSPVQSLSDLAGKVVVIQNGSTASEAVEADKEFKSSLKELVKVSDNVQAMMDLKISGSDAVVMDEVVARFYTEKEKGIYRILDESLADENYVIGFKKGNTALCNEVNRILKEMAEDGKLGEISKTWFGKDITTVK